MTQTTTAAPPAKDLQEEVDFSKKLVQVINRIYAAENLDHILVKMIGEILELFDAEHMTVYAVDYDSNELYSRYWDREEAGSIKEIRVPMGGKSIAGHVALKRCPLNIEDVYDAEELRSHSPDLAFDKSWDKKTGVRTREILTVPCFGPQDQLTGVVQLINSADEGPFSSADRDRVLEIARPLGLALYSQYRLTQRKKSPFSHLIASGALTESEFEDAVTKSRRKPGSLPHVLMEDYKVTKAQLGKSLSLFYDVPFVSYDERVTIPPALLKGIRADYMKIHYWVPLKATKTQIEVLTDRPGLKDRIRYIRRYFPDREIKFHVGLREDIHRFIESAGVAIDPSSRKQNMEGILKELNAREAELAVSKSDTVLDENDSAIVRLADRIIFDAYKAGVSDIHIEPYGDKRETVVRFRLEGDCYEYKKLPSTCRRALVSRLKIMAGLDISKRHVPQDGKIKVRLPGRELELRVATLPTAGVGNEDVVMRVLAKGEPLPLKKLKMSRRNHTEVERLLEKPYGLFLCVGPTGSGKTTTLHSALGYLNEPETKIWTAEDPVEITQYGLRQVQVNRKIGFDFSKAMRAFLRADPDVIMIGEMRDHETASMGIEASLTGHLVLSTLHTNSAPETVVRLLAMGLDPFNFADSLLGVLAQRLIRTLCPKCKEKYHPEKDEYMKLVRAYGEEAFAGIGAPYTKKTTLYRPRGCDHCKRSGYKGRLGLHELLVATDDLKEMIQARATAAEIAAKSCEQGMTTLLQDGIVKTLVGWTDFKQVQSAAMK